jgi:hypothetical protein
MLLILTKSGGCVPLEILSIEDGNVLKSFNHLLRQNKKVDFIEHFNEKLLVKEENENLQKGDFIEQFNEKLLVKQENENLQILDVRITIVIFKYFFIHTKQCTKMH